MQHVSQELERTVILVMKYVLSFQPYLLASSQYHFGSIEQITNKCLLVAIIMPHLWTPRLAISTILIYCIMKECVGSYMCFLLGGSQPSELLFLFVSFSTIQNAFHSTWTFVSFCLEFLFQTTEGDRHREKKKKEKQAAEKMTILGLMRENS